MGPDIGDWQSFPGETPMDPSHLKDRSITTRSELCRAEALNIRKAYVRYLAARPSKRLAPFDFSWLLHLHKEMFCSVWLWAGQLRKVDMNLGVPWPQVQEQMYAMIEDLHCWSESSMSLLEQTARLHHRAVWIHPFRNGNGRWARLLANIWLKRHDAPMIFWPEDKMAQERAIRNDYLQALQSADGGDFGPLLALHAKYAEQ